MVTAQLSSKTPTLDYYNYDSLFSRNGVFNFICGARGLGKTYGAKVKALIAAIRKGDEFVYMRRYKEELQASRDTFFADLIEEFPNHDFRHVGNIAEMASSKDRGSKDRKWLKIGYFIALSQAQGKKSIAYPKVKVIIFDEFILDKGNTVYIANEAEKFLEFYNTVDRWKDKTRVLFLANAVAITNPYFVYWNIEPKPDEEWITKDENFIVVHFPKAEKFQRGVAQTRIGRFIANTSYADYAVGNVFKDNSDALIQTKPSDAEYMYSLETKTGTFSLWKDYDDGKWYAQQRRPGNEKLFTLLIDKMSDEKQFLLPNDRLLQLIRNKFSKGYVYFDRPKTRNAFIQIFNR